MLHYYVIDLETNGLKCDWHETSEISLIRCSDRHQLSRFIKIKHPERTSGEALHVTGRTLEDLQKGDPAESVVKIFDDFIISDGQTNENRVFIGHNVSFDRRFVYDLWGKFGKIFPGNLWLDTKTMAKQYANLTLGMVKPKLTLGACLEFTGIKARGTAHNAVSDTQNTYILHNSLVKYGVDYLPAIKRVPHE